MLDKLRSAFSLVDFPVRGKLILAVLGTTFVSFIELLGVAASYPLLLLLTGADTHTGLPAKISNIFNIDSRQSLILVTATLVGACFILKSVLSLSYRWWIIGFTNKVENRARVNLFRAYLDSPYAVHKTRQLPEIHTTLVTAVTQTFGQVMLGWISFLSSALTVFFLLLAMFYISPIAAVVAIVLFAGAGIMIPLVLRKRVQQLGKDIQEADYISWFASMPALNAFQEMRLFQVAPRFVNDYSVGAALRAKTVRRTSFYGELPKSVVEIVFVVGIIILSALLFGLQTPEEAISTLGAFAVATTRMMPGVNSAIASLNQARAGERGLDILYTEIKEFSKYTPYSKLHTENTHYVGDIELKDISFEYNESPVLDNVNLKIPQGKTIAFVGPSGSGKSTLVDILIGMLTPKSGTVSCGGKNIDFDIPAWQQQIGVVPQNVYILPGNLKENIAFGLEPEEIDSDLALKAAIQADLGSLIDDLPRGMAEDLGQEGNRISGGQRQRVGIARALYRRPNLLVLDEATSALDNKTEYKITQTIEKLKGKATIVIVAHRLSTIKRADLIYFLKDGEIIGSGNFEELKNSLTEFRELVELGKL